MINKINIQKLLKLSNAFESFIKKADLKEDLAKRILIGLAHQLGIQGQAILENEDGSKQQVDVLALRELIPGAKNILLYGTKVCALESDNYRAEKEWDGEEISANLNKENLSEFKKILEICLNVFNDTKNWLPGYGGKAWAKIAETLLSILNSLLLSRQAKSSGDFQKEAKYLLDLMTNINIFESLMHNSNEVLIDMHEMEPSFNEVDSNKIKRLMDAKELNNPEDVMHEIYPYFGNKNKKQLHGLRPYVDALQSRELNKDSKKIDKEIKFIHNRRRLQIKINDIIRCKEYLDIEIKKYKEDNSVNNLVNLNIKLKHFIISIDSFLFSENIKNDFLSKFMKDLNNFYDLISTLLSHNKYKLETVPYLALSRFKVDELIKLTDQFNKIINILKQYIESKKFNYE